MTVMTAYRTLGLTDEDSGELRFLLGSLQDARRKNELRRSYYEGHNLLRDLGIAVPPQLRSLEVVVDWPAKAVDALSRRTILDGFSSAGGAEINEILADVWDTNRLVQEAPTAHTAALIHSCSFVFVTAGQPGEQPVVVSTRSAEDATGRWDARRRALSSALSIMSYDTGSGEPDLMHLYMPDRVVVLRRVGPGLFDSEYIVHAMGVPVEVLPYRSMDGKPFGRSRITRGVRYLTDAAARTLLRTEVGAEFYNAPQRYVLGADEKAFTNEAGTPVPAWSVMLGRMLALSRDDNGELPSVGQFSQQSMQPNMDQLRSLAQMFAAATSLPVGALGIVQDNPSSAEAIRAVNEELGIEIEFWQRTVLNPVWSRVMRRAVGMVATSGAALREARSVTANWGSWALASENALADAAVKQVSAVPWLADSPILLKRMGYRPEEIEQLMAGKARAESGSRLTALVEAARGLRQGVSGGDSATGGAVPVGESVFSPIGPE
jgi:hypothetical protein